MIQTHNIFNRIFIERKKLLFSVFAFGILALSVTFFGFSISKPAMGIILSKSDQGWEVQSIEVNSLAGQAGIQEGDRPVEINGQPAQIFLGKYQKDGVVFGHLIRELSVVDKYGQLRSVSLNDTPISRGFMIETKTWFIVCLMWWISGFYAFFKKPKDVVPSLFLLCSLAFGLSLSANSAAVRAIPTAIYFEIIGSVTGPWLLLHFFLILPEEQTKLRNNPSVYLIYLPAVITLILYPLIGYGEGQSLPAFRTFRIFEYGAGFIAVAGIAVFNYFHFHSIKTQQQMKIVLVGCLAALVPFLILSIAPAAILKLPISEFSILFFVFIPLAMGYAIVTKRLMDIDVIIRRGIIYGLITLVMASVLAVAIFFVLTYEESIRIPGEILIAVLLSGIAIVLLVPVKNGIELLVDRFLYKDRYDYRQIIQSFSTSLNSVKDLTGISRLTVGTTVHTLNLAGGCLFFKKRSGSFRVGASQGIFNEINKQAELLALISQHNHAIEFPNKASTAYSDLAFLIPLTAVDKEVGFFCVSPKASRQDFTSNDVFLLQGIASVVALALHSAMLIHDVNIRDTFVSVASHELRTPLTSIIGYADLILHRNPPEVTRKQWLKIVFENGQRLSAIVDDLLNVSRIQSGKIIMTLEKTKLSDVLEESLSTAKESAGEHAFITEIEPNLPAVLIDRDKFGHVVGNLLSNAIKYSPNGGRITLSARNEPEKHQIVVSISDEGIGIDQADKDSLFTTFHRIQRPETKGIRGSGLGLYIAKEWTEGMGGKIWVESELNKGSTFFIAIPILSSIDTREKSYTHSVKLWPKRY
jgi:signal transduction histidine kinase